jgi:excisionase family DNA binding protein
MTVREAARKIGTSVDTVRRLMDLGQLEYVSVRTRGRPKRLPTDKGVSDYLALNTRVAQAPARPIRVAAPAKRTWRLNPATGRFEVTR